MRTKRAREQEQRPDEPVLELNEPVLELRSSNLAEVVDTDDEFDVAGHGWLRAISTYLTGALIGCRFRLNNSAWEGYSRGKSTCVIDDGYVLEYNWPSGRAPACIVRTVAGGYHYAFKPDDILPILPATVRPNAEKEKQLLELRARVALSFDAPPVCREPPEIPTSHSMLDPELRRLLKYVWLSERDGRPWAGIMDDIHREYDAAIRSGRARPDNDSALRDERRCRREPPRLNAARNATELFAWGQDDRARRRLSPDAADSEDGVACADSRRRTHALEALEMVRREHLQAHREHAHRAGACRVRSRR